MTLHPHYRLALAMGALALAGAAFGQAQPAPATTPAPAAAPAPAAIPPATPSNSNAQPQAPKADMPAGTTKERPKGRAAWGKDASGAPRTSATPGAPASATPSAGAGATAGSGAAAGTTPGTAQAPSSTPRSAAAKSQRTEKGEKGEKGGHRPAGRQLQDAYAELMTPQEMATHRAKVKQTKTYSECRTLFDATGKDMEARAKTQNKTVKSTPAEICDKAKDRGRVTG